VLRQAEVLPVAEYLAAVSGGAYTAIAHTVLVSATLGDFASGPDDPANRQGEEREFFGALPPWAPRSPEEIHLRNHSSYLAHGATGKLWFAANLLYGMIRHLLPFAAGIFLLAAATGFGFHRWLAQTLKKNPVFPDLGGPLAIAGILAATTLVLLALRHWVQTTPSPNGAALFDLQVQALFLIRATILTALFLVALPITLWALRKLGEFEVIEGLGRTLFQGDKGKGPQAEGIGFLVSVLSAVGAVATFIAARLAKGRSGRRILSLLVLAAGPLVLVVPFVGITYWVAQSGLHWDVPEGPSALRLAVLAVATLVVFLFLDEVTPNVHLFYRERLAKSFVVCRVWDSNGGRDVMKPEEPPWSDPLFFSLVQTTARDGGRLPRLVVCAAVNLSEEEIPPGRNAASFTFERDFSGGPATGYVPTAILEQQAGGGVLTLPAMMAVSGAALAPSMGRLTRPGLRLLLAVFNARLGLWLPNPSFRHRSTQQSLTVGERREWIEALPDWHPVGRQKEQPPWRRPGTLYILREALGINTLRNRFVYVTDGGHWENLGLVELLRRGCSQILCFDAAGDDVDEFHTLGNAIALARSDLGVEIEINLAPLKPDKETGFSQTDHVTGSIRYPNGATGVLVFAKATLPQDAPQDVIAFREIDPKFPTHPTTDQFFNEAKFESYRALGSHAAQGVIRELNRVRLANGLYPFVTQADQSSSSAGKP
jgi:hypothetical protein